MALLKNMAKQKAAKEKPANESSEGGNPYLDARTTWIERYGSYVSQAYNWRLIAMLESVALIIVLIGFIYIAGQSRFVPYVVAVDKVGMALAVHPAERASTVDERVVEAQIANFIVNARSVITDRVMQKQSLDQVYRLIPANAASRGFLESWYPADGHSPFDRSQHETVEVNVSAILPVSPSTYEVQWTETIRDLHGKVTGTETWEGSVGVAFHPPTDEATILANPLGLYVTTLSWTKKL